MIEEIDRSVLPPPLYIQMAKDGIWERAWKVTYADGAPTALEVQRYLSGREKDVALEVFFRTADGRRSYFGIRHPQGCRFDLNRIEFLKTLLKIVFESKKSTFEEISKTAALELCANKGALFAGDPDRVDIGVIDYWKSVGKCTVWQKGDVKQLNENALVQALSGHHPELLKNSKNCQGVEFKYFGDLPHWISFEVSEKIEGEFILNPKLVIDKLNRLLVFNQ